MRVYMQSPPDSHNPLRFYHLHLQEDLIEGWNLIREWGNQGARGRVVREHYRDREEAEAALIRLRDEQLKRGYRVVFTQGQT